MIDSTVTLLAHAIEPEAGAYDPTKMLKLAQTLEILLKNTTTEDEKEE